MLVQLELSLAPLPGDLFLNKAGDHMNVFKPGKTALFSIFLCTALFAADFIPDRITVISNDFLIQVQAPRSWRQLNLAEGSLSVGNPQQDAYAMVFSGDLSALNGATLKDFFQKRAGAIEQNMKVSHKSEPSEALINAMPAIGYEITGKENSLPITYGLTVIQGKQRLIMVIAWSSQEGFNKNRAQIESIAKNLTELPGKLIDPAARKFIELTGLKQLIASLPEQFQNLAGTLMKDKKIIQSGKSAFSKPYLVALASRHISNTAALGTIKKINARFQKDDFKEIIKAQKSAASPKALQELKDFLKTFDPKAPPHAGRIKLIDELIKATGVKGQIAAIFPIMWETLMLSMVDISQIDDPPSSKILQDKVDELYRDSIKQVSQTLPSRLFFIYRNLSDEQLQSYIDYAQGPEGQYINEMTRQLIPWLVRHGGYRLSSQFQ